MRSAAFSVIFLFTSLFLDGQDSIFKISPPYHIINVENGLPSSTVSGIALEERGYLFVNGSKLYLFDGSNFIDYQTSHFAPSYDLHFQPFEDGSIVFFNDSTLFLNNGEKRYKMPGFRIFNALYLDKRKFILVSENNSLLRYDLLNKSSRVLLPKYKVHWFNYSNTIKSQNFHIHASLGSENYVIKVDSSEIVERMLLEKMAISLKQIDQEKGIILYDDHFVLYNFETKQIVDLGKYPRIKGAIINANVLPVSNNQLVVSLNNRLFLYDINRKKWVSEYTNEDSDPFISNDHIIEVIRDKYENTYILYNHSGIVRIQNISPHLKFISKGSESDNFTKQILIDEENDQILQITHKSGIRFFDILGNFKKEITTIAKSNNEIAILFAHQIAKDTYHLLCEDGFNSGNYFIATLTLLEDENHKIEIKEIDLSESGLYYSNLVFEDERILQYSADAHLITINKDRFSLEKTLELERWTSLGIHKVGRNLWQLSNNEILIYNDSGQQVDRIFLEGIGIVRCMTMLSDSTIVIGGDNGISSIDITTRKVERWEDVIDCIYAIQVHENVLWCSTNNGIIQLKNKETIRRLNKWDGVQGSEFNTNSFAVDSSGVIYFGGVNGITSFHPDSIVRDEHKKKLIIPHIEVEKKRRIFPILNSEDPIILYPGERAITFKVTTIGMHLHDSYINQYNIPKQTPGWINAGNQSEVNHSFSPGNYDVYFSSGTFFDGNAPLENAIKIKVLPYWYQSKWFYLLITILLMSFIIYIINLKYRAKINEQLKLIEEKEKITIERHRISRELHDNIGVQLGIVGRSIDWMLENIHVYKRSEIKENLSKINEVSVEINQNLRDTIWASKKEMYSFNDVVERISSFTHRIRSNILEIPIHQDIKKNTLVLRPAEALNLYRIVQESVYNSIKHSSPENIWISSIKDEEGRITIQIKDDGTGFDIDLKRKGNGLSNMEKRAEEAGFIFDIESKKKVGTLIKITL